MRPQARPATGSPECRRRPPVPRKCRRPRAGGWRQTPARRVRARAGSARRPATAAPARPRHGVPGIPLAPDRPARLASAPRPRRRRDAARLPARIPAPARAGPRARAARRAARPAP
ncbi:hypothetical protein G6F24_018401 [Rhizopus arrhizus]|nr:hypothetical protein G6F24_018401 [Rhizopus arrhizus]